MKLHISMQIIFQHCYGDDIFLVKILPNQILSLYLYIKFTLRNSPPSHATYQQNNKCYTQINDDVESYKTKQKRSRSVLRQTWLPYCP